MSLPRISHVGWATNYTAEDGARYRVVDALESAGGLVAVPTGTRHSHIRIFRPEAGPCRIYRFRDLAEDRRLAVELLATQLEASRQALEESPRPAPRPEEPR